MYMYYIIYIGRARRGIIEEEAQLGDLGKAVGKRSV
jgi:hypothetical protein